MKAFKKTLSVLLSLMLTVTGLVGLCVPASAVGVGDIILFGNYPQTKVSETTALKNAANAASWINYDYYAGNGSATNGQMAPGGYMKFADFDLNGVRYRAVNITGYRPFFTGYSSGADNSNQDENGYFADTTYYFKYEPLKWRVLDPSAGLVMCESIIDSQPYQNVVKWGGQENYYIGISSVYANNYYESSIRFWLNNDFYYTAFSSAQMGNIKNTEMNNDAFLGYTQYSAQSTDDPVFLLSYTEAQNSSYGLSPESQRKAKGSDYAKCQGLRVTQDGYSYWWLRTAGDNSDKACYIYNAGAVGTDYYVYGTIVGIRPACYLKDLTSEIYYSVTVSADPAQGGTVTGGGTFTKGTLVTVQANPNLFSEFTGWYEDGVKVSSEQTYSFTVTKDTTLRTYFKIVKAKLTLTTEGKGSVIGGGVYQITTPVQITATASSGWHFVGWYNGETLVSSNASYQYPLFTDTTLTAKFEKGAAPDPGQPENPDNGNGNNEPAANLCKWCGKDHSDGFFQKIVAFFHNIFAKLFGAKFKPDGTPVQK